MYHNNNYASRHSRTRDTVKLTVCVCVYYSCNCSTVAMLRKLTASSHVLLDFNSWICKLKLCSRVMATLTHSEGCCSLFRILCSIICPHKQSIQPTTLALEQSACYLLATRLKKEQQSIVNSSMPESSHPTFCTIYCAHAHSVPRV